MGNSTKSSKKQPPSLTLFEQPSDLPPHEAYPLNRRNTDMTVGQLIERDLLNSAEPYIVTGFSSLWYLVSFLGQRQGWEKRHTIRLVFGFNIQNKLGRPQKPELPVFEEEVELLEEGFSPSNWSNLWRLIGLLRTGTVLVRFLNRLHAKIYIGDTHATLGSSNFSKSGLYYQHEANIRVARTEDDAETGQYNAFMQLAQYFYNTGDSFNQTLIDLLSLQLRLTSWEETLARAISELLDRPWHNTVQELRHHLDGLQLWPTQEEGINQALQTLQQHHCVLIADPTGSGKTRLVTTLCLILTHWLWMKGRKFNSRMEIVCPKQVKEYWEQEADYVRFVPRHTMSDGTISSANETNRNNAIKRLQQANILVVDEAHRFLRPTTSRTRTIKSNHADYLILSTATPLSKHPRDIVRIIEIFGVDVLPNEQLKAFQKLRKELNKAGRGAKLDNKKDLEMLRDYLKHLLVRRTKEQINAHLQHHPVPHRNIKGKNYSYPRQKDATYATDCREGDLLLAENILRKAADLKGLVFLEQLKKDPFWGSSQTDRQYLEHRLAAAKGVARYKIHSLLRSSKAALLEHIKGTEAAADMLGFTCSKMTPTGNIEEKLLTMRKGLPLNQLDPTILSDWPWLSDLVAYQQACDAELALYHDIVESLMQLSNDREERKAEQLIQLCAAFPRVIAFDSTLITLDFLHDRFLRKHAHVTCHVPRSSASQDEVKRLFGLDDTMEGKHLALLSDSMSEGVNLPRAQAVLMLDQPSVLRLAEQRIGRIDRLNSPYNTIHVFWPGDKAPFVLSKDIRLFKANAAANYLFGSNIKVVDSGSFLYEDYQDETGANGADYIRAYQEAMQADVSTDATADAFGPVRELYGPQHGLISPKVYDTMKKHQAKVKTKISVGAGKAAWFFVALRSTPELPPRWYLLEEDETGHLQVQTSLSTICADLTTKLKGVRKWYQAKDWSADSWDRLQPLVDRYLENLHAHQLQHLPPQRRRALKKAAEVLDCLQKQKSTPASSKYLIDAIRKALPDPDAKASKTVDPYLCAEQWLELLRPYQRQMQDEASQKRSNRLYSIADIPASKVQLNQNQLEWLVNEAPRQGAQWEQVAACIIAIPG